VGDNEAPAEGASAGVARHGCAQLRPYVEGNLHRAIRLVQHDRLLHSIDDHLAVVALVQMLFDRSAQLGTGVFIEVVTELFQHFVAIHV